MKFSVCRKHNMKLSHFGEVDDNVCGRMYVCVGCLCIWGREDAYVCVVFVCMYRGRISVLFVFEDTHTHKHCDDMVLHFYCVNFHFQYIVI